MAANFEDLCAAYCEIADLAPPDLQPNSLGNRTFTVQVRDVSLTAIAYAGRPDDLFAVVTLGQLPEHLSADASRALLNANMFLLGFDTQTFSRDPATGDIVLVCRFPIDEITPTALYERFDGLARLAIRWRESHFLGEPADEPQGRQDQMAFAASRA